MERNENFMSSALGAIFHTNRICPSHDLALKFGVESMLQHIIFGDRWNDGECRPDQFVLDLAKKILISKECYWWPIAIFTHNTYTSKKHICRFLTDVFEVTVGDGSRGRVIAEVTELRGSSVVLNGYALVMREVPLQLPLSSTNSVLCPIRTNDAGNFLTEQTLITIPMTLGDIELWH